MTRKNVAILHVYYKDRTGIRYKTDIRFGIEDFICKRNFYFLWSPGIDYWLKCGTIPLSIFSRHGRSAGPRARNELH